MDKPAKMKTNWKIPTEEPPIMPFGVNIGEFVEDLDSDYLNYLINQQWFEDKYKKLYKFVKKELDERGDL